MKTREPVDWPFIRQRLASRSGERCEACGDLLGFGYYDVHHRKRRRDGNDNLSNLVILHHLCHVLGPESVHQNPDWARARGLIVESTLDPLTAPLVLSSGRVVLLDDDGFYNPTGAYAADTQ